MTEKEEKIVEILERLAAQSGIEIIDYKMAGVHSAKPKISVTADTRKGITIDQCATFSNELGDMLAAYQLFTGEYQLDVSSPGMSIPMTFDWQFERAIGRRIKVTRFIPDSGKETIVKGDLKDFSEATLTVEKTVKKKKETIEIRRDTIKEVCVVPQW
jgi:ribosome maturation factor RimP